MKKDIFCIFLSSLFLVFSFPNFNLSYLAFIAFVPLFFAIENNTPKKIFLISYLCGFLFYLGVLYWIYHVTFVGLVALCAYLALYLGIFGLIFNFFTLHPSPFTLFSIPLVWVILEYIQAHLFTGFGWCLLGYSQYRNLPLIQIADFSGVYGVSFMIMMANVLLWRLIKRCLDNRKQSTEYRKKNLFSVLCSLLSLVLIFAAVHTYSFFRLSDKKIESDSISISVIQGNIPQEAKWDPAKSEDILNKYINLTHLAAFDNPDLIIWPETSFPDYFAINRKMTKGVLELARNVRIPILLGANTEAGIRSFNSAILVSEKGEIIGQYNKIHLVPFGEYVPFSDRFPILHNLVLGELGEFTAGKEFKIFELSKAKPWTTDKPVQGLALDSRFGVLICFEDIFPEISKKFAENGAQFLVVITNDAWYGRSGAPYQHAASSVFRAIENRIPIVRCANTGYSCFIDSRGRIYDSVEKDNIHLFITGHKTSNINLP